MSQLQHRPEDLALDADGNLLIRWTDQQQRQYTVRGLRDACPCATCREKRKVPETSCESGLGGGNAALQVLSLEETQPLKITQMQPVGNYAYGITFSDGHDSGIYTLALLWELGQSQGE